MKFQMFFCLPVIFLLGCATNPVPKSTGWTPAAVGIGDLEGKPLCLAFSGGGLRAATFSIGIAQGLQDAGWLENVATISATSGGAYASLWLRTVSERNISPKAALDPEGEEQARLMAGARHFVNSFWGGLTAFWGAVSELYWKPWRSVACTGEEEQYLWPGGGFFGYHAPIYNLFHKSGNLKVKDLISNGTEYVFGVTVVPGSSPPCSRDRLNAGIRAAEVSAGGIVSADGELLTSASRDWNVSYVVAAAGGAIDISASDLESVPEMIKHEEDEVAAFKMCSIPSLFRPLLGASFCKRANGEDRTTFMTDGGFTDNLALLPLLKRQCEIIVAVDGSHDPFLEYDGLLQIESELTSAGLGVNSLMTQISPTNNSSKFLADLVNSPVALGNFSDGRQFVYVKLSLPKDGREKLPESVQKYYEYSLSRHSTGCRGRGLRQRCRFPQEATVRQTFHESEYTAYRDLGHWITSETLVPLIWKLKEQSSPD